jgi:hypothetical protein
MTSSLFPRYAAGAMVGARRTARRMLAIRADRIWQEREERAHLLRRIG